MRIDRSREAHTLARLRTDQKRQVLIIEAGDIVTIFDIVLFEGPDRSRSNADERMTN